MNEVRRYLRHTLPGLVTLLIFSIFLLCSDFDEVEALFGQTPGVNPLWAGVLAALASLALGYFLAQIYHSLYWLGWIPRLPSADHYEILSGLINSKRIHLTDQYGDMVTLDQLSGSRKLQRRHAWTISNYVLRYYSNQHLHEYIMNWAESLVDYTHSTGATLLGILISFVAWVGLHASMNGGATGFQSLSDFLPIPIFIVISIVYLNLYRVNILSVEETANSVMLAAILGETDTLTKPGQNEPAEFDPQVKTYRYWRMK